MAVFGIILCLGLLIFFAYRGFSVIFFAPIFALLAALISGLAVLPTYTEIFLPNMTNYIKTYFPFFLLGAVFGKAMEQSGAAKSIALAIVKRLGAQRAILAVVLSCGVLAYGGVSIFVVAFAVYPFGAALFKEANIPKRLLPATIVLGAFTFAMDALPGTPQIQNTIPMKYFNTDLYAAPVFGIIGSILILTAGVAYLEWRKRAAQKAGEGYGENHINEPIMKPLFKREGVKQLLDIETDKHTQEPIPVEETNLPSTWLSVVPLIAVLLITLVLQKIIIPRWDIISWVTQAPYNIPKAGVVGTMNNWALIISLIVGIILAFCINPKRMKGNLALAINAGAIGSLLAVMNTASEVGFGNVIKTLPGFAVIAKALIGINPGGSPLLSEAVTVNVLAGVTGSASGGMSIVLEMFSKTYLQWAQLKDIDPQLLHRVAAMAAGGMDSLPHNGAVITLLGICGLTHKQSYKDMFGITLIKTATVFVVIFLQSIFHFI